jgi:hypothetical protein
VRVSCEECETRTSMKESEFYSGLPFFCSASCISHIIDAYPLGKFSLPKKVLKGNKKVVEEEASFPVMGNELYVRSRFEAVFAEWFFKTRREILQYEPCTFILHHKKGIAHYTPDFWIPERGLFIEVKGMWKLGSRSKMNLMLKTYPNLPILWIPWAARRTFGVSTP